MTRDNAVTIAKRIEVRRRMRRASGALTLILDMKYKDVEELRREIVRWQMSEFQEAERDVQSAIAGRETSSLMGNL
jgi:hypothetical protein